MALLKALKAALAGTKSTESADPAAAGEDMTNPASMSADGDVLFLSKDLFPAGCKEGDEVVIKAQVKSVGSKVGVTATEVTEAKGDSPAAGDEGY